jgi:NAD(P)-dependent dehydrogenase (short-subunit alcohol dehydrogenase family)
MGRLDGRVAIVTGGAKGIGVHYAGALAAEGARLMIADIADGKKVAERLARQHGANSVASAITDVSDEAAVKALVTETMARFGQIDVLVNNAALFAPLRETKCTQIDPDLWDRVMAINFARSVSHGEARGAAYDHARLWQDHQYRLRQHLPRHSAHAALCHSKGGIMAMTRVMALELGEYGIRVNTLSPGLTMSETLMAKNPEHITNARAHVLASRYLKRDLHPQDLLGALVFLASADSDFMTGQNVLVDGGNANT